MNGFTPSSIHHAAAVPDALAFTLAALAARGALVEPCDVGAPGYGQAEEAQGGEAIALLPAPLATELHLGEEIRLTASAGATAIAGRVLCGMGTPLLEWLISEERARIPVAAARLDAERPREAQARAAGDRFVVRNGLCEVTEVILGEAWYLSASIAYVAEADDRHEGLLSFVVEASGGGAPEAGFAALLDPLRAPSRLVPLASLPHGQAGLQEAAPHVARRAAHLARFVADPVAASVERRARREHGRICEYFAALIAEVRTTKRRVEPAAVAAKVTHFLAERDAKLRDLESRFRLRVSLAPAALVMVLTPTATVRLRLRRRKAERELVLRLPAGARSLDAPPCDGCSGEAARPILCDDRLHLLCDQCAPSADGRPRCTACRPPRRPGTDPSQRISQPIS